VSGFIASKTQSFSRNNASMNVAAPHNVEQVAVAEEAFAQLAIAVVVAAPTTAPPPVSQSVFIAHNEQQQDLNNLIYHRTQRATTRP
jgi:hypothetical protein